MSLCTLTETDARNLLCGAGTAPQFDTSFFVEAGAGAGKTYIIVNRIVNQLLSGVYTPEQIVAITFTVKSTEELRKRLDDALLVRHADAIAKDDKAKAAQIQEIHAKLGRMQVSTIHNFCQTILQTMPFEAGIGLDVEIVEDDMPYIEAFYQRKLKESPSHFAGIRALSVNPARLSQSFAVLCAAGDSDIAYTALNDPSMQPVSTALFQLCGRVHAELRSIFITGTATYKTRKKPMQGILDVTGDNHHADAQMLAPEMLAFLQDPAPRGAFLVSSVAQFVREPQSPLRRYGDDVRELRKNLRATKNNLPADYATQHPLFEIMKTVENYKTYKTATANGDCKALDPLLKNLTHSTVVEQFLPWMQEYKDEKAAAHRLDFNDLLLLARNLVRDNAVARQYFQQQYCAIYVDEFQDTDPVQAELLFYLTDGSGYLAHCNQQSAQPNWQLCQPRGGSLFLVGDPKQAIYRFRGADIESYGQVKALFMGDGTAANKGIGQVVVLQNNYRSDAVICDFVDKAFSPTAPTKGTAFFQQSTYQTGYTPMQAARGTAGLGKVSHYCISDVSTAAIKAKDVTFVAQTIADMVANQVQVLGKGAPHPARYDDFLVLTYGKASVDDYVASLAARGIPSVSSGDRLLNDALPIQRGLAHLDVLAHPNNGAKLAALLQQCYDVTLPAMHRFLVRSQGALVRTIYDTKAIAAVRAQLAQSTPDYDVAALCDVGELLAPLMQAAKTQPPMAVLEYLFDGGFALWQDDELRNLREEYAMVQQFLNGVRQGVKGSLADYYAFATGYAAKGVEYQLQLEAATGCVRVMNLHKAKGLEGNVVFLTYSGAAKPKALAHVMRQNGQSKLYHCLNNRYKGTGGFATTTVYGTPLGWEDSTVNGGNIIGKKTTEEAYLAAEALRLNYVAATRAETQLIVSAGQTVTTNKKTNKVTKTLSTRWQNMYTQCLHPSNGGMYPDLMAPVPTAANVAVNTGVATNVAVGAAANTGAATNVALGVAINASAAALAQAELPVILPALWAKECALHAAAATCKTPVRYAISPSKLDHAAPRLQKTEELPAQEGQENMQAPAQAPTASHTPYGADWGTIVHRVMELSVLTPCRDAALLKQYAQQAIAEILPSETLTAQQVKCLFGAVGGTDANLTPARAEWLCEQVASALAFACKPFHKALQDGTFYPELSFFASVQEGDLYDHLKQHLQGQAKQGNETALAGVQQFDVQGYIDLAVLTKDGWIVIDYKTDRLRQGETEAQYRTRLAAEYRNQVSAYGLLLAQATGQPVVGCALCAIPLGGDMIVL